MRKAIHKPSSCNTQRRCSLYHASYRARLRLLLARQGRPVTCDSTFFLANVKEHATLSAEASVDHVVKVRYTEEHENRAADRGCCVSTCCASWIYSRGGIMRAGKNQSGKLTHSRNQWILQYRLRVRRKPTAKVECLVFERTESPLSAAP